MRRIGFALVAAGLPVVGLAAPPFVGPVDVNVVNSAVTVQGSVQTSNDVVHLPYAKAASRSLDTGDPASVLTLDFDVPTGKRLVIETITFQSFSIGGERIFMQPLVDGERLLAHLAPQALTNDGYQIGTHPVKLRVDGVEGSTNEMKIYCGFTQPPASCRASVFGYLVDL